MKIKVCIVMLVGGLILFGCFSGGRNDDVEHNSVMNETLDSSVNIEQDEKELFYQLDTVLPENISGKSFYWVFLQNGRKLPNQKDVQKINDRLHELGVEASVVFHIITIEEFITPEVLTQIYEDLEGQMDFVSIGSALCGFYMDEWQEHFIELSDELKNGELQTFYTTVPENVWDANRINEGIYSFSNSTTIQVLTYAFSAEIVEEYGEEVLVKLNEANGVENEKIWSEIYQIKSEPVCLWNNIILGKPVCIAENPYARDCMSRFANQFEEMYFSCFTDDIRYNLELEKFEWLVESETYIDLKETVQEYYNKGYLGEVRFIEDQSGFCGFGNTAVIQDMKLVNGNEIDDLFVPIWNEAKVSRFKRNRAYMYSFVYNEAQSGWQEMLNALGSDEQISGILNQDYCHITIAAVVYEKSPGYVIPDIDDQYEMIELVYTEAQSDPIGAFIFNPVPIEKEWEEYNQLMSAYEGVKLVSDPTETDDRLHPNFETMDMIWKSYQDQKEEAHIDLVLAEINRQYTEWENAKSGIG